MNIALVEYFFNGHLMHTLEYEYDSRPNPYNRIFNMTGCLLRSTTGANFSINNPVSRLLSDYYTGNGIPLYINNTISYDYNSSGLPVKIYTESDTVRITYQ
jgi:hypothetical protein